MFFNISLAGFTRDPPLQESSVCWYVCCVDTPKGPCVCVCVCVLAFFGVGWGGLIFNCTSTHMSVYATVLSLGLPQTSFKARGVSSSTSIASQPSGSCGLLSSLCSCEGLDLVYQPLASCLWLTYSCLQPACSCVYFSCLLSCEFFFFRLLLSLSASQLACHPACSCSWLSCLLFHLPRAYSCSFLFSMPSNTLVLPLH